jgi:serine/threonine protein kinase/outer membrane protein assembly factor BamB
MVDRVGQQLGNYRLTKLLGQGGFAEVYLGEHIYLKTPRAIKMLHTRRASQKDTEDFFKEAQAITKLKHPNIIRVLDFGVEGEIPFLVMDYAPYGTLRHRYPKKTQVPLPIVMGHVKQVAAALQYAHDANIIHRDVKPDNMLLGQEDILWLSDFGIALTVHSSTDISTQDAVGTIAYMAPEQFQGKPRRASDQYALGLVVYEWLTGDLPFHGSFAELGMQHMHNMPAPLREKVPALAPEVEKVVLRALAKDPDERYGSVEEFAKELGIAAHDYQKMALHIPRRIVLKRLPQTAKSAITASLAFNQTIPISTIIQQQSSQPMKEGSKIQVRRSGSRWQIGVLVALAALIVAMPFIYPMVTSVFSFHAVAAATKPITAYDKNALANGMMFGYDAAHTRVNPYEKTITPENVNKLVRYWNVKIDGEPTSPTVVDGIVYIGSSKKMFYAFKADCMMLCTPLWQAFLDQATVSSPAVIGDIVYINTGNSGFPASQSGLLYAFSAQGCKAKICKPLWIGKTGGPIYGSPTIAKNTVFVASADKTLYAFKASKTCDSDCKPEWMGILIGSAYSTPTVSGKFVYIGDNKGLFYAFNISGCGLFKCYPIRTASTGGQTSGSAAAANGFIYTGSTHIPGTNSQNDHNLHVFDASCGALTCQISWTYPTGKSISSSPAISDNIVYVGADDGYLYAFNTSCSFSSCTYLWKGKTGDAISYSSPTVANGVVFIGSKDHYIYAFRASASCGDPCPFLWKFDLRARVSSSPVVANGVVYVASQDNNMLYAFHLPKAIS